jgi:hypothetical protein
MYKILQISAKKAHWDNDRINTCRARRITNIGVMK